MSRELRVGHGTDRHPLRADHGLVIAGVTIESEVGTLGHSDADPACHAAIDALLGGAGLGDIGSLFPPSDARWEDADSINLLRRTSRRLKEAGWRVVNLDLTVHLESVDLAAHRDRMRANLADAIEGDPAVSVKFKRGEGLGPVGRDEAVEADCVALLEGV